MIAALALVLAAAPPGPRIVSINPCVDAVLMQVADPRQIAGISHYSQDPEATSIPLTLAHRFKATSGTAEEVVALAPDLVITGSHVAPSTIAALRRMKVRMLKLPVPETVAESDAQIRTIAAAIGHPAAGAALVARIDAAVAAATPPPGPPIAALVWQGGGLVPGAGTLADELLRRTGFRNLSADYGLKKWDVLPIEYLVDRPPAVLLSVTKSRGQPDRMLSHPAVAALAQHIAVRPYPFRLLQCAGPTIITAVTQLAAIRASVTR
ncbi:MAG: ABC transporter substrate-binding protein [Janthinobacterium lividum]